MTPLSRRRWQRGSSCSRRSRRGTTLLGNMELSTLTGIPRPTVARLTHTLAELGYLRYDAERAKYRVGARALRMAHPLLADMKFRQVARPMMQELAQQRSRHRVDRPARRDLDDLRRDRALRRCRSARARHRHADSGGDDRDGPRRRRDLATGGRSSGSNERLAAEDAELWVAFRDNYRAGIAQCASRGFCTCLGEYMASIHAVAAPAVLRTARSRQSFSINCGIPAFRLQPGQLEAEIGPRVAALADSIRALVGQAKPAPPRKAKENHEPGHKMAGPLEGLKVLDIATIIAAPFTRQLLLAGYGAEVLKIEMPGTG